MDSSEILSARAQHTLSDDHSFERYIVECLQNMYHPENNPDGIVDLGRSEDRLMEAEIEERLRASDVFEFTSSNHQYYYELSGKQSLRTAAANFLNIYFKAANKISPDKLVVMSGAASCLDSLSFALFDPGDVYITPTPVYNGIFIRFNDRSLAQPCPLELSDEPDINGDRYVLTPEMLEDKILELQRDGRNVRGFVLLNPQNPFGAVYRPPLVRSLLEVCTKYKIHAIFDEVYALSIHNPEADVCSVLSIPNLPDPERTHFVWAFSKDMGLAGLRIGFIHTLNSDIQKVLKKVAVYGCTPSIVQDAAASILSDTKWLDEIYFPKRRQRLRERYTTVKHKLEEMGAYVLSAEGGIFIWVELKTFLRSQTTESEFELFEDLFKAGLYTIPGYIMKSSSPGWFRVNISAKEAHLEQGLRVLETVLKGRSKIQP